MVKIIAKHMIILILALASIIDLAFYFNGICDAPYWAALGMHSPGDAFKGPAALLSATYLFLLVAFTVTRRK